MLFPHWNICWVRQCGFCVSLCVWMSAKVIVKSLPCGKWKKRGTHDIFDNVLTAEHKVFPRIYNIVSSIITTCISACFLVKECKDFKKSCSSTSKSKNIPWKHHPEMSPHFPVCMGECLSAFFSFGSFIFVNCLFSSALSRWAWCTTAGRWFQRLLVTRMWRVRRPVMAFWSRWRRETGPTSNWREET